MRRSAWTSDVGSIKRGDEVVGNETKVKVVKNKVSPFQDRRFRHPRYGAGISREGEIYRSGVANRIIEKSGAWVCLRWREDRSIKARQRPRVPARNADLAREIENKVRDALGVPLPAPGGSRRVRTQAGGSGWRSPDAAGLWWPGAMLRCIIHRLAPKGPQPVVFQCLALPRLHRDDRRRQCSPRRRLKAAAIRLLSTREHARQELKAKLQRWWRQQERKARGAGGIPAWGRAGWHPRPDGRPTRAPAPQDDLGAPDEASWQDVGTG